MVTRRDLEKKIADKALKDPTFKKALLSDPKNTLKKFLKNEIKPAVLDRIDIKIYEEKKNEWVMTLPYYTELNKELTDEDLKHLAAGVGADCWGSVT